MDPSWELELTSSPHPWISAVEVSLSPGFPTPGSEDESLFHGYIKNPCCWVDEFIWKSLEFRPCHIPEPHIEPIWCVKVYKGFWDCSSSLFLGSNSRNKNKIIWCEVWDQRTWGCCGFILQMRICPALYPLLDWVRYTTFPHSLMTKFLVFPTPRGMYFCEHVNL